MGYICEIERGVCSCAYLCRKRTQGHMACEPFIRTDSLVVGEAVSSDDPTMHIVYTYMFTRLSQENRNRIGPGTVGPNLNLAKYIEDSRRRFWFGLQGTN